MRHYNRHLDRVDCIETKNLRLYKPQMEDAIILANLWLDPTVRKFLGGIISLEEIPEKINSLQAHWDQYGFGQWGVYEKNLQLLIGVCGLQQGEYGVELSYMFFPAFWGKGRATEALIVSLFYGFKKLNLAKIIAITQDANIKSCLLLERMGMVQSNNLHLFNAVQRQYFLTRNTWENQVSKKFIAWLNLSNP